MFADFHRDAPLKVAAARFGDKFLTDAQALIHGDLHTGSVMVTPTDARVIDPEIAMMGPNGFDLGAYMGNLLLSWYSQPGHASAEDDRKAMQEWILEQVAVFGGHSMICFSRYGRTRLTATRIPLRCSRDQRRSLPRGRATRLSQFAVL